MPTERAMNAGTPNSGPVGTEAPIGTLLQYARAIRATCLAEYPGLTPKEYDACYPPESRQAEWIADLKQAARQGATIRPTVLDDLWKRARGAAIDLSRTYGSALPTGYLFPDVRRANQLHEAEMRAARRQGRARAD